MEISIYFTSKFTPKIQTCQVSCSIIFHLQLHQPACQVQLLIRSESPQARYVWHPGSQGTGAMLKHYVALEIICALQTSSW